MLTKELFDAICADKNKWPDGPWKDEPDNLEFEYKGYKCSMRRNFSSGSWLGYVLLPVGDKYHGKFYDDIPIEVHGGLTYSDKDQQDLWKIGFDCAHYMDMSPLLRVLSDNFYKNSGLTQYKRQEVYRDVKFVRKEIRSMVRQLIKLQESNDDIK